MKQEPPQVTAARIEAARARARLMDRAHALQARLSPKTLARHTWEGAKIKGADLAEDAVDAVRKRPLTATGIVAAVAMFLAREPLVDLAERLIGGRKDDDREDRNDKAAEDRKHSNERHTKNEREDTETA